MKRLSLQVLKYLSMFIFVLFSLIWILSPFISHNYIQKQLTPFELILSEQSHIRYNPFVSSLTIETLSITKDQQQVLAIKHFVVELNLYKLLIKQLYVKNFDIDGLYLKLTQTDNQLTVAGIKLPNEAQTKSDEGSEQAENNYQLVIPAFSLSNSEISLAINQQNLLVNLEHLKINALFANLTKQSAQLDLKLAVQQSVVQLKADAELVQGQGIIESTVNISQGDLTLLEPMLPKNLQHLTGILNFSSKQKISLNEEFTQFDLVDTQLNLDQLTIDQDKINLSVAKQSFNFPQLHALLTNKQAVELSGLGNIELSDIKVSNNQQADLLIMQVEQLALNGITVSTPIEKPQLAIAQIALNQVVLSQNTSLEAPAFTRFSQLAINDITLLTQATNVDLSIDNIILADLNIDTELNDKKVVVNLQPLTSLATIDETKFIPESNKQDEELVEQPSTIFNISLNDFHLTNPAQIHFNDLSVEPNYQRVFTVEQLTFGPLNSTKPEQESLLVLKGKSNEYANFSFDGVLKPFSPQPLYALKGQLNEVSLPAVSAYIKDALNYEIKSGQLNISIDAQLAGDEISGETSILLRGLDFTAANDHEANSLKDKTAIPFSVALGMLKDSQGNVELTVPLSGNTNDPSFGVSGFITLLVKKATMMAAKDYLMATFVPYANVISIAMTAGEHLLKVRFNDLIYAPKQITFVEQQQSFLQQFGLLMQDKQETQITLCAIATVRDLDLPSGSKIENKQLEQLNKLSLERLHYFKQYMIEQYKIESSRLLLCNPQIDSDKDAQSRLTFDS